MLEQIRDVDLLKRVVLKRSVYGVDLNPMAVELAKLALWLDAFVPGLPLSYLDHNLRQGNSLVGVVGEEVTDALQEGQATLEEGWIAERLQEARDRAREAVERVEYRVQDVRAAEEAELQRRVSAALVKTVFDRWTADSFDLPGARDRIGQMDTLEAENDRREAEKLGDEFSFFHWPLEFPEVFGRDRPGFDVVVANPPWEKLKVERHDFFQMKLPGLKFVTSAAEREARIQQLVSTDPSAQIEYEAAIESVERLKRYFQVSAGNYRLHGGGDADLFKAFAERFMYLVRSGGSLGCILPRQLLGGAGSFPLRRQFFNHWVIDSADVLWNRRVWAFPSVFHRTRMTLLAAEKREPNDPVIPSAGPLDDEKTFRRARELRVSFPLTELAEWSGTLELPSLPDAAAGAVFMKMMQQPRFDSPSRHWRAIPYAELHATADSDLYNEDGRGWPVWKGRTFDRYHPDLSEPVYWAEPEPVLERLQEKRSRSRGTFDDFPPEVLVDPDTLPPLDYRIVFRDVVRATDRRTMKACLAPRHIFAIHDAPQLVWPRGDATDQMALLAVLNSLPFDWVLRRRVETHVTFSILNALPIPALDEPTRLAELAARLSCVDERYAEYAAQVGVSWGDLDDSEREGLEAEVDVLVARAYGLDADDLEVVFSDFVVAAVSPEYRDRLRELMEQL